MSSVSEDALRVEFPSTEGESSAGPSSQTSTPPDTVSGSRKRTLSSPTVDDDDEHGRRVRRREPEAAELTARSLLTLPLETFNTELISSILQPSPRTLRPTHSSGSPLSSPSRRLTRRQSRQSLSRASSVSGLSFSGPDFSRGSTPVSGFSFQRHSSVSTTTSLFSPPPTISDQSSKWFLRDSKLSIAYEPIEDALLGHTAPLSWSTTNLLVFGRGNRVHCKNLSNPAHHVPDGLFKVKENDGDLRLLSCAGLDAPNTLAVSTAGGLIQLYDIETRQMIRSWRKGGSPTALAWSSNPSILSVGGEKGTIRHFDTRIKETNKMTGEAQRVTRHQAMIWSVAWKEDGKVFASGDGAGVVLCWDARMDNKTLPINKKSVPMDVGDLDKRRRRMQHVGPVKALAWCPWSLKTLASGDAAPDGTGTIRLWNIDEASPKELQPSNLELDAQVTSLQWSTSCRELFSTHGTGIPIPEPPPTPVMTPLTTPRSFDEEFDWDLSFASASTAQIPPAPIQTLANSIAVHSFPHLAKMKTQVVGTGPVNGSAVSPNGQRVVVAVPGEKLLKVWEVWGKRKTLARQRSVVSGPCGIR